MENKVALITGGIGDIGTALCHYFSQQGANVIALDFDLEKALSWQSEQKAKGYNIHIAQADVTEFESCAKMAKEVEKKFGKVDILVNAAGTIQDAIFQKMTPSQWNEVVHTDLDSIFNVTRQFINGMIDRGYGRIISIASVNAEKGQFGQTNYASAKAGIYGFTKSLAQEVAKHGITVNAVSPGYVNSRMVMSITENTREKIIRQIPIGRLAKPAEIAWAIGFLACEKSAYITGINLPINGGLHM